MLLGARLARKPITALKLRWWIRTTLRSLARMAIFVAQDLQQRKEPRNAPEIITA